GLLNVLRLLPFVIAPLEVEPQHRDSPLVDETRIELEIGVLVRNHFAAPREAHRRSIHAPVIALERRAVAAKGDRRTRGFDPGEIVNAPKETSAGHVTAAADFDVVATGAIQLLVVEPPRHVKMHAADAVLVVMHAV